ncbi:MAG TPA: tyrosine-type recombinase/integrase [Lacunisphaera sp.]|nr:tyrosine-type recombinase/integrase [Lacunisphaera sp.]
MIASLFRRDGRWHCKIQLESWPRERRFSLGTTDKRVAQAKLQSRLADCEKEAAGIAPPRSVREASKRPLAELVALFLADLTARDKAPATVKRYGIALRKLSAACGWSVLAQATTASFCEWRKDCGHKPATQNAYLNAWSRFFRWLKRQRLALENPFEFVDPADTCRSSGEYRYALTAEQVSALLATAPEPRRTFYRLILETGIRPIEIRRLRVCDVIAANEGFGGLAGVPLPPAGEGEGARGSPGAHIRMPGSISKNGKTALASISSELARALVALRRPNAHPNAPAFVGVVPKCPAFRKDLGRAGIPSVDGEGRRADLHALRKTFGVHLVLSGADPRVVMEAMRHADLKLTMKTYMDASHLRGPVLAAVAALPWNHKPTGREAAS